MSVLTKPRGNAALGRVVIDGRTFTVMIEVEWDRYLAILTERAGGTLGLGTTDVDAGYFAAMQPISMGGGMDTLEILQPCMADAQFADITQTGGECCLPEMTFQG
jgi:hypothetical protein